MAPGASGNHCCNGRTWCRAGGPHQPPMGPPSSLTLPLSRWLILCVFRKARWPARTPLFFSRRNPAPPAGLRQSAPRLVPLGSALQKRCAHSQAGGRQGGPPGGPPAAPGRTGLAAQRLAPELFCLCKVEARLRQQDRALRPRGVAETVHRGGAAGRCRQGEGGQGSLHAAVPLMHGTAAADPDGAASLSVANISRCLVLANDLI